MNDVDLYFLQNFQSIVVATRYIPFNDVSLIHIKLFGTILMRNSVHDASAH